MATDPKPTRLATYDEFWAFYLSEHGQPGCRALHYVGASVAFGLALRFGWLASTVCGMCALPAAYACAWAGHFLIERNRPATWRYPLWSLRAELELCLSALSGRLYGEFERLGVPYRRPFT